MAYFDSPKNRVKWQIELEELRQQKEDFAAGRLQDMGEIKGKAMTQGQHRRPITYEQLEQQEARAAARPRREKSPERTAERSRERSKPAPSPSPGHKGG